MRRTNCQTKILRWWAMFTFVSVKMSCQHPVYSFTEIPDINTAGCPFLLLTPLCWLLQWGLLLWSYLSITSPVWDPPCLPLWPGLSGDLSPYMAHKGPSLLSGCNCPKYPPQPRSTVELQMHPLLHHGCVSLGCPPTCSSSTVPRVGEWMASILTTQEGTAV